MASDDLPRSMNVLVVDDHPGIRYLLDIVITESGHRVFTAQNGIEAVEVARNINPQLVFMDIRMPLMGGLEALSKIKSIYPKMQVVIMTAYGSEDTISQAQEQGALCCFIKPFDVDDIKKFLEDFNRRRAEEEMLL